MALIDSIAHAGFIGNFEQSVRCYSLLKIHAGFIGKYYIKFT